MQPKYQILHTNQIMYVFVLRKNNFSYFFFCYVKILLIFFFLYLKTKFKINFCLKIACLKWDQKCQYEQLHEYCSFHICVKWTVTSSFCFSFNFFLFVFLLGNIIKKKKTKHLIRKAFKHQTKSNFFLYTYTKR